jgi:hypothetical protein
MIIPAPRSDETAITILFHKSLADWTADDRKAILRRLKDFMRDRCKEGRQKPRRRKGRR